MFETLCVQALAGLNAPAASPAPVPGRGGQPAGPPPRATGHLYFVGQTEFPAWAITTSAGIIIIDTIFDYSVNDEVIEGAARFREIAARAGADALLSNHTNYDGTKQKIPQLAARKAGDPNPYVVGTASVQRYLTTVGECAQAGSIMSR
jgi:hypothetical protein